MNGKKIIQWFADVVEWFLALEGFFQIVFGIVVIVVSVGGYLSFIHMDKPAVFTEPVPADICVDHSGRHEIISVVEDGYQLELTYVSLGGDIVKRTWKWEGFSKKYTVTTSTWVNGTLCPAP